MKFIDMKPGMKLHCVDDYADCIHKGLDYVVVTNTEGGLYITCDMGAHDLESTATDSGELPEFVPAVEEEEKQ